MGQPARAIVVMLPEEVRSISETFVPQIERTESMEQPEMSSSLSGQLSAFRIYSEVHPERSTAETSAL